MRACLLFVVATAGTAIADDAVDRAVIADVERGEALWRQSCPIDGVDGTCARLVTKPRTKGPIPSRCGPDWIPELVIVRRDAAKVTAATAAFDDAIARFETRGSAARAAYARAKLAAVDIDYETFLANAVPAHLDFRVKTNAARFSRWRDAKTAAAAALRDRLHQVSGLDDPATVIAATARLGQVELGFANALFTSEIPAEIKTDASAVDAYCDLLTVVAEPLEVEASRAFETCLAMSSKLAWFDDSSKRCERELARIRPDEFPPSSELRVEPGAPAPAPTEVEGPR